MRTIKVKLQGVGEGDFEAGRTIKDVVDMLAPDMASSAVAARLNGMELVDLSKPLFSDCEVEIIRISSEDGRVILRHSAAHLLAFAVKELYKGARLGFGPPTSEGFYYDVDVNQSISLDDLPAIEEKMRELSERDIPFRRLELPKEKAIELFEEIGEVYKLEHLRDIPDQVVSVYENDGFYDLCRGPHLPSTGWIKHFKLLSVSGAYWKGDSRNPMLQRIYGTAFETEEELRKYLERMEEARRRDHRILGKDLGLFQIHEEIGAGLPIFHPYGAVLRITIEDFIKEKHLERGYLPIISPHIARLDLWKISGHWDFYRDKMYSPIEVEDEEYILKPMNCPFHIMFYKSKVRSYRDLPIRLFELGTVYRYEISGTLHGLLRVRGFTQDDAHIFCLPDQLEEEVLGVMRFAMEMLSTFGFSEYEAKLSTRPEKFIGDRESWEKATEALRNALESSGIPYDVDEGGGAFYGPKIDIGLKDSMGRDWQCTTIQVDFNLPDRFDVSYRGPDGMDHRPVIVHRAILGSLERFMGILVEHYGGAFPTWLSPVQVRIIPVADRHIDYAGKVFDVLKSAGLRVEIDKRSETVGSRIRDAQLLKIPYMIVIGDKEEREGTISVRHRSKGEMGTVVLEGFIEMILREIERKGDGL